MSKYLVDLQLSGGCNDTDEMVDDEQYHLVLNHNEMTTSCFQTFSTLLCKCLQ